MMEEMTNDELIEYCAIHCQTPRALFHRKHIKRMIALAGCSPGMFLPEFMSMHEDMERLVELARKRKRGHLRVVK
jgi:hypothetical protein